MPWFKVDDSLAFHAKTVAAGNAAMGLWVRAGSWCMQQVNDGKVPTHMVAALGNAKQAAALVTAGLWLREDDGYRFHDWLTYQPSSHEIRAERAAKSEAKSRAGRLGGLASGVARRANVKQDGSRTEAGQQQNAAPTRPDPTRPVGGPEREEVEVELRAPEQHFDEPSPEAEGRALRAVPRPCIDGYDNWRQCALCRAEGAPRYEERSA